MWAGQRRTLLATVAIARPLRDIPRRRFYSRLRVSYKKSVLFHLFVIAIEIIFKICFTHQTKYVSMKVTSIPRPRDRLGYCRGATIISNMVVTIIIVCIKWFNHHGKYGSNAFGNTSSRSTNINAQKVTPTNWNVKLTSGSHHIVSKISLI